MSNTKDTGAKEWSYPPRYFSHVFHRALEFDNIPVHISTLFASKHMSVWLIKEPQFLFQFEHFAEQVFVHKTNHCKRKLLSAGGCRGERKSD